MHTGIHQGAQSLTIYTNLVELFMNAKISSAIIFPILLCAVTQVYAKFPTKIEVRNQCTKELKIVLQKNRSGIQTGHCSKVTIPGGHTRTISCDWSKTTRKDRGMTLIADSPLRPDALGDMLAGGDSCWRYGKWVKRKSNAGCTAFRGKANVVVVSNNQCPWMTKSQGQ